MSLSNIREEVLSKLIVDHRIAATMGGPIKVGQTFTVQILLYNKFKPWHEPPDTVDVDYARFTNVKITVKATRFAAPVGGDHTIELDQNVPAGQIREAFVEFRALEAIESWGWGVGLEPYVVVKVEADFDFARFFHATVQETWTTNIHPLSATG